MKAGLAPRVAAARALGRVLRGGAWSNMVVEAEAAGLGREDQRLVRRLLYGSLRSLARIDRTIGHYMTRPIESAQPVVLDVLRIATFELIAGEGAAHAAVDTAVDAVRALDHPRAAGFVNGVLRAIGRGGEPQLDTLDLATRHAMPDWLVGELTGAWGEEPVISFLRASDRDAPRTARFRPGAQDPDTGNPTPLPDVRVLPEGPVPEGAVIQDVASAAVVRAMGPVTGLRVLDVAAAPGGKTLQLWDQDPALLVATDVHPRRLARARKRLGSLGYPGPWLRTDGRRLPFPDEVFDRVLVDAPCTGLGTLRRRPELRHRVTPAEVERLAALQERLVDEAIRVTTPDGQVVYSVCTVTQAETEGVAGPRAGRPPPLGFGQAGQHGLLLTPHADGTDGMFISVIARHH